LGLDVVGWLQLMCFGFSTPRGIEMAGRKIPEVPEEKESA
jgi:hypothetical protein